MKDIFDQKTKPVTFEESSKLKGRIYITATLGRTLEVVEKIIDLVNQMQFPQTKPKS